MISKYAKPSTANQPNKPRSTFTPTKRRPSLEDRDDQGNEYRYARIPRPMNYDLKVKPASQYSSMDAGKGSGAPKDDSRYKKIAGVLGKKTSGTKAAPKLLS